MATHQITVSLNIPADEFLAFYQGKKNKVHATADDGRTVLFPANILQKFLTHTGIHGSFLFSYNEDGKLVLVERIS